MKKDAHRAEKAQFGAKAAHGPRPPTRVPHALPSTVPARGMPLQAAKRLPARPTRDAGRPAHLSRLTGIQNGRHPIHLHRNPHGIRQAVTHAADASRTLLLGPLARCNEGRRDLCHWLRAPRPTHQRQTGGSATATARPSADIHRLLARVLPCDTKWEIDHKTIQMFHELNMPIIGDGNEHRATTGPEGWTLAKDGSRAVWDKGFRYFLGSLPSFENDVLPRLKFT